MSYFVDVIIPIPLEKLYTYAISPSEARFLKIGMRVAVPLGKSKVYTALVFAIHQNEPQIYEAKDIHQILDETPIVNPLQLKHWLWISEYYMCTLGEVMRIALPSAFVLESETIVVKNKDANIDVNQLKDDEYLVYEALHNQSPLRIHDIINILDKKNVLPVIKRLLDKKVVVVEKEFYEKYKPKLIKYIKINPFYTTDKALKGVLETLKNAEKQRLVILKLFSISATTKKPLTIKEIATQSGVSVAVVRALVDKNILQEYFIQTDRVVYSGEDNQATKVLNEHQEVALKEIISSYKTQNVTLLHGITSSGKTEIYSKLIEQVIAKGKQVLFLLPEIALTVQLVKRLQLHFGGKIAVYHSKYSPHERVEVWYHVLNNSSKSQIVLGARSSLFLPFSNLGLIVVDEEHDQSYKQFEPSPRYHARDSAIVLSQLFKAKVLLGSATPSIESFHNVKQEKYGLVTLKKRYNNVMLPEIELVDLKDKQKRKLMKGHFSDRLIEEMTETLNNGYQVLLFQNRRGYSPIVECNLCGFTPQCKNCDVSLTFHKFRNQLRCHYCSYFIAAPQYCLACGGASLETKGFGTQQIEQEAIALFPNCQTARMDLDTTRGKYGFEKIITAFEQHQTDILVGTRMLTKGLDFRNVKLVGVINADAILNFPDFRAHERCFQLLLQVSGRAGRTEKRGKVLIQTYNPNHKILQQASSNNYNQMFDEQLEERYNYKYPPFFRLVRITIKHKDYQRVELASNWYAKSLRQIFHNHVLGPEFPVIPRIRNLYQKNIMLKIPSHQSLSKTKNNIRRINKSFKSIKDFRPVRLIIDVDAF